MNTDKVVVQNCELPSTSSSTDFLDTDERLDLHCEDGVSDTSTIHTKEEFDRLCEEVPLPNDEYHGEALYIPIFCDRPDVNEA